MFGKFGFGEGVAGHITVRDPEFPELFWVNPFGMSFRHIKSSDLILLDHDGNVVYGSSMVNQAAFVLHSAIHEARPDVIAAAHSHSPYGKSFSSLGIPLAPLTQDACIFYNDHTLISEHGGAVVNDIEAGRDFARLFPEGKAAIHQNHGLFTVGESVDEAAFWFVTMERSCQAQLMAMAAGTPIEVRDEYATHTHQTAGSSLRRLAVVPAAVAGDHPHRPRTVRLNDKQRPEEVRPAPGGPPVCAPADGVAEFAAWPHFASRTPRSPLTIPNCRRRTPPPSSRCGPELGATHPLWIGDDERVRGHVHHRVADRHVGRDRPLHAGQTARTSTTPSQQHGPPGPVGPRHRGSSAASCSTAPPT